MSKKLDNSIFLENNLVRLPQYSRDNLIEKWIHIGLGNFHRSHQAFYLHKLLENKKTNWSIIGLEIKQENLASIQNLKNQDYLYTLITKNNSKLNQKINFDIIGSITSAYFADNKNIDYLKKKIEKNNIEIITITITENGYYEKIENLDFNSKNIISDLKKNTNLTIYGTLYNLIKYKKDNKLGSFSVISCDNIMNNGDKLKKYFMEFCHIKNPELAIWIKNNITFPNTMVDRITPKYNVENSKYLDKVFNFKDECVVESELYIQWIIENKINHKFPNFEKLGVKLVDEVNPYQEMKMKMLNASHCSTSFIASLSKFKYVYESFNDDNFILFINSFLDEDVIPFLKKNFYDYYKFKSEIIDRFSNKSLPDTIERTTFNGSKNLEIFIKPSLINCFNEKKNTVRFSLIYASWLVYIEIFFINNNLDNLNDENMLQLKEIFDQENLIDSYLSNKEFPGITPYIDVTFKKNFYMFYELLKKGKIKDAIRLSSKK